MRLDKEMKRVARENFVARYSSLKTKIVGINEKLRKLGINERFSLRYAGYEYVTVSRKGMVNSEATKPIDEALQYIQGLRDMVDYIYANVKMYAITEAATTGKSKGNSGKR